MGGRHARKREPEGARAHAHARYRQRRPSGKQRRSSSSPSLPPSIPSATPLLGGRGGRGSRVACCNELSENIPGGGRGGEDNGGRSRSQRAHSSHIHIGSPRTVVYNIGGWGGMSPEFTVSTARRRFRDLPPRETSNVTCLPEGGGGEGWGAFPLLALDGGRAWYVGRRGR